MPRSSKLSRYITFPHQNSAYNSLPPVRATYIAHLILLDHLNKAACLYTYYSDGQFEENDMGKACSMYGEWRGAYRVFGEET